MFSALYDYFEPEWYDSNKQTLTLTKATFGEPDCNNAERSFSNWSNKSSDTIISKHVKRLPLYRVYGLKNHFGLDL